LSDSRPADQTQHQVVAVLTLICSAATVSYCVWTLDRGFELTDEAYYLLSGKYPEATSFYISGQHWILDGLWRLARGIVAFRAWGLALLIGGALILAGGIVASAQRLRLISGGWPGRLAIAASCTVCSLLYATTINLSPSYNLLAAAGAYSAAGLVLLYTVRPNHWSSYAPLFLAGAALGVEAICKASAGAASFGIVALWVLLNSQPTWRKLLDLAMIALGICATVAAALLLHTSVQGAHEAMSEGLALFRMVQVEPVPDRLLRYLNELIRFAVVAFAVLGLPLLLWKMSQLSGRRIFIALALVSFITLLGFGFVKGGQFSFPVPGGFLLGGTGRFESQMTLTFVLALSSLVVALPAWRRDFQVGGLMLGLFLLPYSVAVGSGNSLVTQVVVSLASWGGLVALVAFRSASGPLSRAICAVLVLAATSQIVSSNFSPYHMNSPLHQQQYPVAIADIGDVKVDAKTRDFIHAMRAAVKNCEIASGSPYLGLYNVPGVALLTGTIPLYSPWLNDRPQADFVLAKSQPADLKGLVVAINRGDNGPVPPLPEEVAGFPTDFKYCGKGFYPYNSQTIEIWQIDNS